MKKEILIIGGTRFVGPLLIQDFLSAGFNVTIFHRGNGYINTIDQRVKNIIGDRSHLPSLRKLFKNSYDFVYDMCCYSSEEANSLIKVGKGKIAHLVFFSSAAVYKKPITFPLLEDDEKGEWSSFGKYGTNKANAEDDFIRFAKKNNIKLTIFRPVYILGKKNYFDRENYYFSRILCRKPILVSGNGKALIQFCDVEDVVSAFFLIPLSQKVEIEILNVSNDEYISLADFINLCGEIAKVTPKIVYLDCKKYGLDEEHFYDDLYPFPNTSILVSNEKIKRKYNISFKNLKYSLRGVYIDWVKRWDRKVNVSSKEEEILKNLANVENVTICK